MKSLRDLEVRHAGSLGVAGGRPFVARFDGAGRAWRAVLGARRRQVPVRLWKRASLCGLSNLDRTTCASAELGDVIDHIASRGEMFADDGEDVSIWTRPDAVVPELTAVLPAPSDLTRPCTAQLWIGGRGQATTLHEDEWHNYNFQLFGSKRFIVFPPEDAPLLLPRGDGEFDTDATSPDGPPCGTGGFTCTLHAGDVLFLPKGWPHQVVYLTGLVANLNYWSASHLAPTTSDGA